jgi:hypothetical protein
MTNHNITSLILLAIVLTATPQLRGAEQSGAKIDRRVVLDTDGKAIRDAQTEIEAAKLEWENRLRKLAIHLEAEGRQPLQDPDYQGWAERLEQLREDQAILKRKASEAFIAFVKFRLSPDAKSDKIYRQKLKDALSGADSLGTQYRQLQDFKNGRQHTAKMSVEKTRHTHVTTGSNSLLVQKNPTVPGNDPVDKKSKKAGEEPGKNQQSPTSKPDRDEVQSFRLSRQIQVNPLLNGLPREFFMREGAVVIRTNGTKYLIATGGTVMANDDSPVEQVRCRIVARARALKIASGFLHGIECESQTAYTRGLANSNLGSAQVNVTEEISEILRLHSKGILRGMETVGAGKSPEGFVYHALAFKLP